MNTWELRNYWGHVLQPSLRLYLIHTVVLIGVRTCLRWIMAGSLYSASWPSLHQFLLFVANEKASWDSQCSATKWPTVHFVSHIVLNQRRVVKESRPTEICPVRLLSNWTNWTRQVNRHAAAGGLEIQAKRHLLFELSSDGSMDNI